MEDQSFLLVSESALPAVYPKVVEAKRLIESGSVRSVAEAVRCVGISRSVFYKYKDCVFAYHGRAAGRIITMQVTLDDRPGVLSSFLSAFTQTGANILTVNQSIPVGGSALVSISAGVDHDELDMPSLILKLRQMDGVRSIGSISDD